jgi:hypothetical protein
MPHELREPEHAHRRKEGPERGQRHDTRGGGVQYRDRDVRGEQLLRDATTISEQPSASARARRAVTLRPPSPK